MAASTLCNAGGAESGVNTVVGIPPAANEAVSEASPRGSNITLSSDTERVPSSLSGTVPPSEELQQSLAVSTAEAGAAVSAVTGAAPNGEILS